MGWMEPRKVASIGNAKEVEDANRALDEAGIEPGPLAIRAWKAALMIQKHKNEGNQKFFTVDI